MRGRRLARRRGRVRGGGAPLLPVRAGVPLLAALMLLVTGCTGEGSDGPPRKGHGSGSPSHGSTAGPAPAPAKGSVTVRRTVATGLKSPWGLAPLPGGDVLVSSRDSGEILRIDGGSGKKTEVGSVPGVSSSGQGGGEGGLLGIALPRHDDRMLYAYLTTESDNRIVRMPYDDGHDPGDQLGAPDTVFKGIPKGRMHNGGRIAFGPDGMLYAGTGESGEGRLAQDKKSPGGKILRMTPDGEPPKKGNPYPDSVVYSYGHRNVQGLDWDTRGRLWASEFGQHTWDELNLIKPAHNYGWPNVEGRASRHNKANTGEEKGSSRFTDPVEQWRPADASPSGLALADGSAWMAGLRGERLWRIPLRGDRPAAKPQSFLKGRYGRLRTVVSDGSGGLWLTTSETDGRGSPGKNDDRLLRLAVR
jgi:aldose sugar dehydrogenase